MTATERQTPDITGEQLATISSSANYIIEQVGKLRFFNCWQPITEGRLDGLDLFPKARLIEEAQAIAAALGYRLVALEPAPVTSEPGFDGRDGGRMNEHSSAQEA